MHQAVESKITKGTNTEDCWIWSGAISDNGYGNFGISTIEGFKKTLLAHRYIYIELVGDIPRGFDIDHLCRNRKCVNPLHLEAVSRSENINRGLSPEIARNRQLSKTHCPNGHEYAGENLRIKKSRGRSLSRVCRTCDNENKRNRRKLIKN